MVYILFPIALFPIVVPGILSAGIFAFTLSRNEFIDTGVEIGLPVHRLPFRVADLGRTPPLGAMAVSALAPTRTRSHHHCEGQPPIPKAWPPGSAPLPHL